MAGRTWGIAFATSTRSEPLPPETEDRLAKFTQLVAIALANAQTRSALQQLAGEQAALRRVGELVARAAPVEEVMAAITYEASAVSGDATVTVRRFDAGTEVLLATWPPGDRTDRSDPAAIVAPVTVHGRAWGVLTATPPGDGTIAAGTRDRVAQFADRLTAALTNAESPALLRASRARIVTTADETRRRMSATCTTVLSSAWCMPPSRCRWRRGCSATGTRSSPRFSRSAWPR